MLVDGSPPEVIVAILNKELDTLEERHMLGNGVLKNMGGYAPAFGMVGTLIGLIAMLQDLSDPAALGQGMAVALLTTLYGAFFANMFFIPWANKLYELHNMENLTLRMLLEGMLAIQAGDAPRVVSEKMMGLYEPGPASAGFTGRIRIKGLRAWVKNRTKAELRRTWGCSPAS